MNTIEMVESAPGHWEAECIVAHRHRRWAGAFACGTVSIYLLAFAVLWLTDFR